VDCVTRRSLLRILLFGHDGRCVFVFVLIFWPTIIIKDVLKCLEFLMTIVPVITRTGNSFTSSNFIRITLNVVGLRSFRLRSWPFKNRTWYSMITITRTIYGRAIFTVRGWSVKISLCLLLDMLFDRILVWSLLEIYLVLLRLVFIRTYGLSVLIRSFLLYMLELLLLDTTDVMNMHLRTRVGLLLINNTH
jgi:hypothetical protein